MKNEGLPCDPYTGQPPSRDKRGTTVSVKLDQLTLNPMLSYTAVMSPVCFHHHPDFSLRKVTMAIFNLQPQRCRSTLKKLGIYVEKPQRNQYLNCALAFSDAVLVIRLQYYVTKIRFLNLLK